MNLAELSEMFGAMVVVQFTQPIFLVKVGAPQRGPVISEGGAPVFGPQGMQMREYVAPEKDEEAATFIVKARLGPAAGGRVSVCYELADGHIAYVAVRPEGIFAATIIHKIRDEGIIKKPD